MSHKYGRHVAISKLIEIDQKSSEGSALSSPFCSILCLLCTGRIMMDGWITI